MSNQTVVYTLRAACESNWFDHLDQLVEHIPAQIADTHISRRGAMPYISVSFRAQRGDHIAQQIAADALTAAGHTGESYLFTGYGVHRRLIDLPA